MNSLFRFIEQMVHHLFHDSFVGEIFVVYFLAWTFGIVNQMFWNNSEFQTIENFASECAEFTTWPFHVFQLPFCQQFNFEIVASVFLLLLLSVRNMP